MRRKMHCNAFPENIKNQAEIRIALSPLNLRPIYFLLLKLTLLEQPLPNRNRDGKTKRKKSWDIMSVG